MRITVLKKDYLALISTQTRQIVPPALSITVHRLSGPAEFHRAADVRGFRLVVVPAHRIGDATQHRMKYWAVQALIVVGYDQLPIGLYIVDILFVGAEIAHTPSAELLREICQLPCEGFRPIRQIQEDVSVPDVSVHGM